MSFKVTGQQPKPVLPQTGGAQGGTGLAVGRNELQRGEGVQPPIAGTQPPVQQTAVLPNVQPPVEGLPPREASVSQFAELNNGVRNYGKQFQPQSTEMASLRSDGSPNPPQSEGTNNKVPMNSGDGADE